QLEQVSCLGAYDAVDILATDIWLGHAEAPVHRGIKGLHAIYQEYHAKYGDKRYGDAGNERRDLLSLLVQVHKQEQQWHGDERILLEADGDAGTCPGDKIPVLIAEYQVRSDKDEQDGEWLGHDKIALGPGDV